MSVTNASTLSLPERVQNLANIYNYDKLSNVKSTMNALMDAALQHPFKLVTQVKNFLIPFSAKLARDHQEIVILKAQLGPDALKEIEDRWQNFHDQNREIFVTGALKACSIALIDMKRSSEPTKAQETLKQFHSSIKQVIQLFPSDALTPDLQKKLKKVEAILSGCPSEKQTKKPGADGANLMMEVSKRALLQMRDQSMLISMPLEVLTSIFRYFKSSELGRVSLVCTQFHEAASIDLLWKKPLQEDFPWWSLQENVPFKEQYRKVSDFYSNVKRGKHVYHDLRMPLTTLRNYSLRGSIKTMGDLFIGQCQANNRIIVWQKDLKGNFHLFDVSELNECIDRVHTFDQLLILQLSDKTTAVYQRGETKFEFVKKIQDPVLEFYKDLCVITNDQALGVYKISAKGDFVLQQILPPHEGEAKVCFMDDLLILQYRTSETSSQLAIWKKNQKGLFEVCSELTEHKLGQLTNFASCGNFLLMANGRDGKGFCWKKSTQQLTPLTFDYNFQVLHVMGNVMFTRYKKSIKSVELTDGDSPQLKELSAIPLSSEFAFSYATIGDFLIVADSDNNLRTFQMSSNGGLTPLPHTLPVRRVCFMQTAGVGNHLILSHSGLGPFPFILNFSSEDMQD